MCNFVYEISGLTVNECICALADSNGSVGQVAEKIHKVEFLAEVSLVSQLIEIKAMVLLLEGGAALYDNEAAKLAKEAAAEKNIRLEKHTQKSVRPRSHFDQLRGIGVLSKARERVRYDLANDMECDLDADEIEEVVQSADIEVRGSWVLDGPKVQLHPHKIPHPHHQTSSPSSISCTTNNDSDKDNTLYA